MNIRKILIILICSLVVDSLSVSGIETIEIEDEKNDVLWYDMEGNTETTSEKPNVDILFLSISIEEDQAEISLTVAGEIENKGNIEKIVPSVAYMIMIITEESEYSYIYCNNTCISEFTNESIPYSINDSTLTIFFDLTTSNIIEMSAVAMSSEFSLETFSVYVDEVIFSISEENETEDEESEDEIIDESSNNNSILFFAVIIIFIIVIIVAVYIIMKRR